MLTVNAAVSGSGRKNIGIGELDDYYSENSTIFKERKI